MRITRRLAAIFALALAAAGLAGCTALMSTTDVAAKAVGSISEGLEASTNVSITEPEGVHYVRARAYVASQMPMIRREAANGGGENIRALATLMGVANARAFGRWLQDHYALLFIDLAKPQMLVARIKRFRGPNQ